MVIHKSESKALALLIALVMIFQLTACGVVDTAKSVASSAKDTAVAAKDAVVEWYESIDLSAFKDGWDAAVSFAGSAYAAAISSEYITNIGTAINDLKVSVNSAAVQEESPKKQAMPQRNGQQVPSTLTRRSMSLPIVPKW